VAAGGDIPVGAGISQISGSAIPSEPMERTGAENIAVAGSSSAENVRSQGPVAHMATSDRLD